jgi:hypothetical protein
VLPEEVAIVTLAEIPSFRNTSTNSKKYDAENSHTGP